MNIDLKKESIVLAAGLLAGGKCKTVEEALQQSLAGLHKFYDQEIKEDIKAACKKTVTRK